MSKTLEMVEMRERLQRKVGEAIAEFQTESGTIVSSLVVESVITRTVSGEKASGGARIKIDVELP